MATCRGLHHIFDTNPIPEHLSSFIDSLSKIKPPNPIDHHSFTEIFGELHFKENSNNNGSDTQKDRDEEDKWRNISKFSPYHRRSESSSSMNSESLQLCTEGLGFESLDNLEDLDMDFQSSMREKAYHQRTGHSKKEEYHKKGNKGKDHTGFPPPISSIGGNYSVGKPSVCFESYREGGRFILKEVRIPTQECLHACREDGRLRLSFVQETEEDGLEFVDEDFGQGEEGEGEGMNGDENEDQGDKEEDRKQEGLTKVDLEREMLVGARLSTCRSLHTPKAERESTID